MMRLPLDRILFCVVAVAVSEPDLSATEADNGREAEAGYFRVCYVGVRRRRIG